MDILDSTDDDEPFFGFDAEDIVLREVRAESDIDVGSVSSVHTSDLSDWDSRENDFESDVDDQVGHPRDRHGWSEMTRNLGIEPFVHDTGPNIANLAENGTPKDFFFELFKPTMIETIVEQTNKYAREMIAAKPNGDRLWADTNPAEIRAYLGVLILMGIHSLPRDEMYWSSDDRLGVPGINKVMPLKKFKKLSEYVHLCDNDNLPDPADVNRDRLFKVRKLIDMANETFLAKYKPAKEISIDEAMVPFKGRSSLRQYMPIKPIKWGMKVWCAAEADTGYLLQFDVYCGKRQDGTQRGLGHDVVMKLARPFLGRYHHLYFDNFFSSVALMTGLLQEKTYACATVCTNRIGLPEAMKHHRKLAKGQHLVFQKDGMLASIWHDKRDVNLLSTNCSHGDDGVPRWDRLQRDRLIVPCPTVVRLYNEHMGGVDTADQMRGYYSTVKKSHKYWRYLMSFVFDACINNAFILFDKTVLVKPKTRYALLDFRLDLADELIGGFSSRKKKAAKRKHQTVDRDNVSAHKLIKFDGRKRACVLCRQNQTRTSAGRAVESSYGCDVCQVNFCKDTCFPQHLGAAM